MKHAYTLTTGKTSAENLIYMPMEQDSVNFGTRNNKSLNILMLVIMVYTVQIHTDGKSLSTIQTYLNDIHVPRRIVVINTVLSFIRQMKSDRADKISSAYLGAALQISLQVSISHTSIIKKSY